VTTTARAGTVIQGGRAKAYRPLPDAERATALRAGLAAYGRGDFFEAHELLEPAWMGTADPGERDLHQGLIKLAAAFVHAVRRNQQGVAKNLVGARDRLAAARDAGAAPELDLAGLVIDVEDRLARLARAEAVTPADAPRIRPASPKTRR